MASHDIIIRIASEADAESLAALAERTFRATFGGANTADDMDEYVSAHFSPDVQRAQLRDPGCLALLVQSGPELIGYAQLLTTNEPPAGVPQPAAELQRFYVEATHHGRGIAQMLMRECVAASATVGAAAMWLGVWERNSRAIAFYRNVGFEDIGSHSFLLGSDLQTDRLMLRSF